MCGAGNCRPLSATSARKSYGEDCPGGIERHLKNKAIIRCSQHGFVRGRSCLGDLFFHEKVACLVGERRERM